MLGIGVELVPWAGLALLLSYQPVPALHTAVPQAAVVLPLLILLGGSLTILARRGWLSTSSAGAGPPTFGLQPTPDLSENSPVPEAASPHAPRPEQSPDTRTSLADRAAFLEALSDCLQRAASGASRDESAAPALITLRLPEYREVTESFGHQAGQDLLTAVASRIADLSPPIAATAHIAEDTFAVLLPERENLAAREVGRDLLRRFDVPFDIAGHGVPIEAHVGLAVHSSPGTAFESAESMLRASYSALHQVQRQGGDNFNVYQEENQNKIQWLRRRERLREAIHSDELTLYYQPIVHLVSEDVIGAEALVRWNHPERGLLSPAAFLPLAEETGLVEDIDRWVLRHSLEHAKTWTTASDLPLDWVSVNISPQAVDDDFQSWCLERLGDTSVPDGSLHLEITERWALHDERPLQSLRENGVRLSIDDFGTGYSSLRYLRSLNADVLKIDRAFIQDLGRDEETTAIVQFLMNLSLRLDVEVVAEGVNTPEQLDILRDFGCAMAQGYHFAPPMPADTFIENATSIPGDASPSNGTGPPSR